MILSEQQPPEYPLKTWWNNCFDYYHWNVFEYFTEAASYHTDLGWIDRSLYVIISISCTIFMSSSHITAIHSAFVHYFSFLPNTYTHTHTHTHTHRGDSDRIGRCMHAELAATWSGGKSTIPRWSQWVWLPASALPLTHHVAFSASEIRE